MNKQPRRFFAYLALAVALLALTPVCGVILFRERIIRRFIAEADKYIKTPVRIDRVDVSFWGAFPRLGIVFDGVYVEDSFPEKSPFLQAESISFYIDPIAFLNGQYEVLGLDIYNSSVNLKVNKNGENNYAIFESKEEKGKEFIDFRLKNVQLAEVDFYYEDGRRGRSYRFSSHTMDASIVASSENYDVLAKGQLAVGQIASPSNPWFRGKNFAVNAEVIYTPTEDRLTIKPSALKLRNVSFEVQGEYVKNYINLSCKGRNTSIQTLLSLIPESSDTRARLAQYNSEGNVYFNASLKGGISGKQQPALNVRFGLSNANLFHPEYTSRMSNVNLDGSFSSSAVSDLSKAVLSIKNVRGKLDNQPFEGEAQIKNLQDPYVRLRFKGAFTAPSVVSFYPIAGIDSLSGNVDINIFFEGQVGLLKDKSNINQVIAGGEILLHKVGFDYGAQRIHCGGINGALRFDNNSIILDELRGRFDHTDVQLHGVFKNIVPFLVSEHQPLGVRIDIQSPFIDIDRLIAIQAKEKEIKEKIEAEEQAKAMTEEAELAATADEEKKDKDVIAAGEIRVGGEDADAAEEGRIAEAIPSPTSKVFHREPIIPEEAEALISYDFGAVQYDRMLLRDLKGDLALKRRFASINNISFNAMGGSVKAHGAINAKNIRAIDIIGSINLKDAYVDSMFYVFRNFQQDFLKNDNLKGRLNAVIDVQAVMNERLRVFSESVAANADFTLRGGELNNLESLEALSKYVPGKADLTHVMFSELSNAIIIKDKTISIPPMKVQNNVLTFIVGGTHTFDQQIEYRLTIPLSGQEKIDNEKALEAVERSPFGGLRLHLKVTGTTKNYHISYDREAVRKKFSEDIKEEVKELKEAFRNKGKQEEEMEIEEDSYFDWDQPEREGEPKAEQ